MVINRLGRSSSTSLRILQTYPRQRCASVLLSRAQSTAATADTPSPKITAIPFAVSMEDVEYSLKLAALLASPSFSNLFYAFFLRYFGERFTSFLKEFGLAGHGLKHLTTKAVYFPTWQYDYIGQGLLRKDKESAKALLTMRGSSISGNPFSPLSLYAYSQEQLPSTLPTYNPARHLNQNGSSIAPVPFTVSPLKVIEGARRKFGNKVDWAEQGLVVDVPSWKDLMLAVYPVYFPLYLSEWEYRPDDETKARRITVGVAAHSDKDMDQIFFPRPVAMHLGNRGAPAPYWFRPKFYMDIGLQLNPINKVLPTPNNSATAMALTQNIDEFLSPRITEDLIDEEENVVTPPASPLAAYEGEVDWSDERIMSWASNSKTENYEWIDEMRDLEDLSHHVDVFTTVRSETRAVNGMEVNVKISGDKHTLTEVRDALANKLSKRTVEVEANKPAWLKAWQKKQQVSGAAARRR